MEDLVQRLRRAYSLGTQADFGLSQTGLYLEAANEIERLRSLAGAVSPGQSVADIKEYLRKGFKSTIPEPTKTAAENNADVSRESSGN